MRTRDWLIAYAITIAGGVALNAAVWTIFG